MAKMKEDEFSAWWSLLSSVLVPGTSIQHWSAAGGLLPGTSIVNGVDDRCVRIEGPENKIYQRLIRPEDFRNVLNVWQDYCKQIVSRKAIDRKTKHSTYVIAILHWMEINSK